MDTRAMGLVVVELGGGRRRSDDKIDAAVGLSAVARIGDEVGPGAALAVVHARDEAGADRAEAAIIEAITIGDKKPDMAPVIGEIITA
jgi:thymidine phosphorylase